MESNNYQYSNFFYFYFININTKTYWHVNILNRSCILYKQTSDVYSNGVDKYFSRAIFFYQKLPIFTYYCKTNYIFVKQKYSRFVPNKKKCHLEKNNLACKISEFTMLPENDSDSKDSYLVVHTWRTKPKRNRRGANGSSPTRHPLASRAWHSSGRLVELEPLGPGPDKHFVGLVPNLYSRPLI